MSVFQNLSLPIKALGLLVFTIMEWIHADPTMQGTKYHESIVIVSSAGAITFLTGISGYWGSLHLEHGMIFAFSYTIYAASIIELSVGAIILSVPKQIIDENTMNQVKNRSEKIETMFEIQVLLNCCGSKSPLDWLDSNWWREERKTSSSAVVPISCCKQSFLKENCTDGTEPFRELLHPDRVHNKGCGAKVLQRKAYLLMIGGCSICACGMFKLISFLAIHYLANIILTFQLRLDEIREQLPNAIPVRLEPVREPKVNLSED